MGEFILDDLYKVSTDVTLPGGRVVQVRALSELDTRNREEMAMAARIRYVRKLKDPESDEYLGQIASLEEVTDEGLRDYLVSYYTQTVASTEAIKANPNRFIPEPDEAEEDEKLAAREEQERADNEVKAARDATMNAMVADYKAAITDWPHEQLLAEAKAGALVLQGQWRYYEVLRQISVYLSTYSGGKRLFKSHEEAASTSHQAFELLYNSFVDVNTRDPWSMEKAALRGN